MTWFFEKDLCSAIDKVQCQLTTSPPRILAHWVPHYSEHEPDHKWAPHGHDLSLAISLNHKKIENLYLEIGFTISWLRLGIIFWVHYISYPDLVLPFFGYNSNTLPRSSFSWLSYSPTRIRRCSPIGQALYKIKSFLDGLSVFLNIYIKYIGILIAQQGSRGASSSALLFPWKENALPYNPNAKILVDYFRIRYKVD